ncbi:Transmembrane protein 41A [Podila epigama]|nr:Transmembrane protein 41A [Podila epigama]
MSSFVASATMVNSATAAALGRFHSSEHGLNNSSYMIQTGGRQRSSSLSLRTAGKANNNNTNNNNNSTPQINNSKLNQQSSMHHSNSGFTSKSRSQGFAESFDRINFVPTITTTPASPAQEPAQGSALGQAHVQSASSIDHSNGTMGTSTGRSRSNTLTGSLPITAASNQFEHVIRPRRPSLVNRSSSTNIHSPASGMAPATLPAVGANINSSSSTAAFSQPHSTYPPPPLLPQYNEAAGTLETTSSSSSAATSRTKEWSAESTSSKGIHLQLGFLPRILALIGLFVMSLGGLYLIAQLLPPLSLPKSIEDVKVDAVILQEFATATYEGWLRTFWVFSVVYLWKQCFGIPGSAFLNILAGALYGPWFGTLLTSALTTVGSVFAYFMSFFLMEPIMNRYASTRLDQMRTQIQKKTARKSSSRSIKATATSTAVETSVTGTVPISDAYSPDLAPPLTSTSAATTSQRGTLRTRSSSFTVRGTSAAATEQGAERINVNYSYLVGQSNISSSSSAMHSGYTQDDVEIQESEGLLEEERISDEKATAIALGGGAAQALDHDNTKSSIVSDDNEPDDADEGTSLFMQLLLIRLFPLTPYWFINLASPLVGVPVIPFMTSMFLGCMPYNYICAQAGAILGEIHELRDIYQQPWILFQIVIVLVLSAGATFASKKWTKKQAQEQDVRKNRSSEEQQDEEALGNSSSSRLLAREDDSEQDYRSEADHGHGVESYSMASLTSSSGNMSTDRTSSKRDSAIIDMSGYRF